ncbi:unnamed protein product [Cuscuta europaea]|uniref:Uncharacterized protein n=1 Tax=Cuscuta europaea TaxID=41803 RepID=A0A9P1E5Z1_CUSEU|nr:unnamed protein product [Cuscuta europaea]
MILSKHKSNPVEPKLIGIRFAPHPPVVLTSNALPDHLSGCLLRQENPCSSNLWYPPSLSVTKHPLYRPQPVSSPDPAPVRASLHTHEPLAGPSTVAGASKSKVQASSRRAISQDRKQKKTQTFEPESMPKPPPSISRAISGDPSNL